MEKLENKLWKELEEIADKPDFGAGDLEASQKLASTLKNLYEICMLEGEGGGYSSANRGKHYVRGHYSRDSRDDGMVRDGYSSRRDGRGRYSRDDGRSEMMEHLEMALDSATEQDREVIRRFINKLKNA